MLYCIRLDLQRNGSDDTMLVATRIREDARFSPMWRRFKHIYSIARAQPISEYLLKDSLKSGKVVLKILEYIALLVA